MDKENVTKLEILHGYDDYLDSLNRKLDYISDQLYSGDKHSIDELTDLVLYVEIVNFELLKFYKSLKKIGEIENKHNRILDIIFKLSLSILLSVYATISEARTYIRANPLYSPFDIPTKFMYLFKGSSF